MSHSLTVREKEHWKERISKRIDRRIEAVFVSHPGYREQSQLAARERALESLGITAPQLALERLEKQAKLLQAKQDKHRRQMLAKIRGVPLQQVSGVGIYTAQSEVNEAVAKRQALVSEEILADSPHGRQILSLRAEKDNLLDTVWLATSPKQIKDVWKQVNALLGDEQTPLQREALAIEPVEDE